eukprot:scaffold310093_cov26-Tisochrysis_lutea.AAC.1
MLNLGAEPEVALRRLVAFEARASSTSEGEGIVHVDGHAQLSHISPAKSDDDARLESGLGSFNRPLVSLGLHPAKRLDGVVPAQGLVLASLEVDVETVAWCRHDGRLQLSRVPQSICRMLCPASPLRARVALGVRTYQLVLRGSIERVARKPCGERPFGVPLSDMRQGQHTSNIGPRLWVGREERIDELDRILIRVEGQGIERARADVGSCVEGAAH